MPSPFPGMDPYIEASESWEDFHVSFLTYIRDSLRREIGLGYSVRIENRAVLEAWPEEADEPVLLGEFGPGPITIDNVTPRLEKESYVVVRRQSDQKLVTVIELCSPTTKMPIGRVQYSLNRASLLRQDVHLVEIDLLIRGKRLTMKAPLPPGDYYAFVSRAERRPTGEVCAWSLRNRLPTIPIPLLEPDPDFRLDLAALFAEAYERGSYHRELKYTGEPPAFLRPADRDWVRDMIKAKQ